MRGLRERLREVPGSAFLALSIAAGLVHLAVMLAVVLSRMGYRYELEWTEGSVLAQALHVARGFPVYSAPTPEYAPYLYTPLYFWIGAAASAFGGGFLPLRLISFAAIAFCMALAYAWVRRETGRRALGWLAVGIFASAFRPTGFWFDLARVDCLCLLWLMLGLRFLAARPGALTGLAGAAALASAFLTKQSSLAVIAALVPFAFLKGLRPGAEAPRRKAFLAAFLAGLASGVPGAVWILDRHYQGWFTYYVFTMPSGHASIPGAAMGFWTRDLLWTFPLPTALAAWALFRCFRAEGRFSERAWFLACATAGMLGNAWISRTHVGSWDNVLLPAFAWLAVMAGFGAAALPWRGPAGALLALLFLLQFARLGYDPRREIPTAADRAFGDSLVARIAALRGEVWVPDHGHLAAFAGKTVYGNRMPLEDVVRGRGGAPRDRLRDSLSALLASHRFGALLLDTRDWRDGFFLPPGTGDWYALSDTLPLRGRAGFAKTGVKSLPRYWYTPIGGLHGPSAPEAGKP